MSSFPESKVEKWINAQNCRFLLKYNETQFTRIYPKGGRIDSSNYDPIKMWNCSIQMAALNYQTPDRAMQLNEAKFMQNAKCGYLLRNDFMFENDFNPYDRNTLHGIEPLTLTVKVSQLQFIFRNEFC
jgi:phosphatidylinositol phospholipase C gamma-1